MSSRVHEAVKAIALCHNVTPVYESNGVTDQAEAEKQYEDSCRVYQASSPDEVSPGQVQFHRDALPVSHGLQAWPPRGFPGREPGSCRVAGHIHVQMHAGLGLFLEAVVMDLRALLSSKPGWCWSPWDMWQHLLVRPGKGGASGIKEVRPEESVRDLVCNSGGRPIQGTRGPIETPAP